MPTADENFSHQCRTSFNPEGGSGGGGGGGGAASNSKTFINSWLNDRRSMESFTSGPISLSQQSLGPSLGPRRQSWLNLMDSEETLGKRSSASLAFLPSVKTETDGGGLTKLSAIGNRRSPSGASKTSKTSQPLLHQDEFILVPPTKKISVIEDHVTYETGPERHRRRRRISCNGRRILICGGLTVGIFLIALVIGIIVKRFGGIPNIFRFDVQTAPGEFAALRIKIREFSAEFLLTGASDLGMITANADFGNLNKFIVYRLDLLPEYCFATYVNLTAFSSIEIFTAATEEAKNHFHTLQVLNNWNWEARKLQKHFVEQFNEIDPECKKSEMLWLERSPNAQRSQCEQCYSLCLPSYGTLRDEYLGAPPFLTIIEKDCFWLRMQRPGNQYISGNDQKGAKFLNGNLLQFNGNRNGTPLNKI